MTDLRTTLTVLVTGIIGGLAHYDIVIPKEFTEPIIILGLIIFGWFASDKKS